MKRGGEKEEEKKNSSSCCLKKKEFESGGRESLTFLSGRKGRCDGSCVLSFCVRFAAAAAVCVESLCDHSLQTHILRTRSYLLLSPYTCVCVCVCTWCLNGDGG